MVTGAERQDPPKADPKGGRGGDHQPRHERNARTDACARRWRESFLRHVGAQPVRWR